MGVHLVRFMHFISAQPLQVRLILVQTATELIFSFISFRTIGAKPN